MNRKFLSTIIILFLSLSTWLSASVLTAHSEELTDEVAVQEIVNYDIQVSDIQPTTYNESIRAAALSGNGHKVVASIAIEDEGPNNRESALYLCNSDGTGLMRILDSKVDLPDERRHWDPIRRVAITDDGNKIAFGWLTDYGYSESHVVVSTINADGTGLKEVARVRNFGGASMGALAISGDGSRIAFSTKPWKEGDADSDFEVFLVNADGTDMVQLTDNDVEDAVDYNYKLDISDDGTRVVWQQGKFTYESVIYKYESSTGVLDVLTEGYNPSISGDGQTVLFGFGKEWPYKVGIIGFDGTGLQTFDAPDWLRENFISDDGNAVAFLCGPGGIDRLMFMRSDGTDKVKLDTASDVYAISDDGTKVLHRHGNALYTATIPSPPHVPEEFVLVGTSTDEGLKVDINQVFASSDAEKLSFKFTTHRPWEENMFIYLDIDADQDPNTGSPESGVDYEIFVLMENGVVSGGLFAYDPSQEDFVLTEELAELICESNSDICQFSVMLSDIGNPDAVDFGLMIGTEVPEFEFDFAPDVGFYTYGLEEIPTQTYSFTVDFSTFHNSRLQDIYAEYPEGDVILGSIPFSIPTGGNNMWSSSYSDPNPHQIDISVGVSGVSKVYTLINSAWGQDVSEGSFAAIEFYGFDGAFFRKDLYGNVDIRDHYSGNWTNSINSTTTINVFNSSGGQFRLDMQTIDLPDDFLSQTLETIRVIDTGGQTFQRIFLAGITVESAAPVEVPAGDNALSLDGDGDYVDCGNDASLNITDEITIEVWVKTPSIPASDEYILMKSEEPGDYEYGFSIARNTGQVAATFGGTNLVETKSSTLSPNTWYHIAATWKYPGNCMFYTNGVQTDSIETTGNITPTSAALLIGKIRRSGDPYYFDGMIDEVRIWNAARTQDEIQAEMYRKLTGSEAGLVAYYDFDEAVGSTIVHDRTANGNDGTLHGDAQFVASTRPTEPVADTTPPTIISGPDVSDITSTSAMVTWDTNEASSSVVEYGAKPEYGLTAEGEDGVTEHSVSLSSLSPDTTYYYRVGSTDASDNTIWSEQKTFKTLAEVEQLLKGDVDNDGEVSSDDAILTLRIAARLIEPTDDQKWAADMNNDGIIRSNDAILILRKAAGLAAPSKELIAAIERTITVMLEEAHGVAGENITVPLKVDNIHKLAGGNIGIAYDSSVLRAVDVSSDSDILLASNITEYGTIQIAFASTDGLSNETVVKIKFDVLADDVSPLTLQRVALYRSDALPFDSRKIDSQFSSWAIPPEHSALLQNFPNPFNPETWMPYQLEEGREVTIRIYSVTGELVRALDLGRKTAGLYVSRDRAAHWDGRNKFGALVASGVYFYSIQADDFTAVRKLIVLK